MPIVAYISMKRKKRNSTLVDTFSQIKVNIKTEAEIPVIAARKDFVRWRVGNMTLDDVIARRKQEGRSNWYV
jgi:hypothetical protein